MQIRFQTTVHDSQEYPCRQRNQLVGKVVIRIVQVGNVRACSDSKLRDPTVRSCGANHDANGWFLPLFPTTPTGWYFRIRWQFTWGTASFVTSFATHGLRCYCPNLTCNPKPPIVFIPLTSDAELRYWPIMTGVMIFLNIVAYPIQWSLPSTTEVISLEELEQEEGTVEKLKRLLQQRGMDPDELDGESVTVKIPGWQPWALSHGDGLHPVQWLTCMYMHGSVLHLLGNMLFLWVFGLVVEGRIGAFWFAIFYLGCGLAQNCLGQLMFLFSPAPSALGASGVIYSLMMAAALWAPGDHIQSIFVFFITLVPRFIYFEIPILILAAIYFLADFGMALFNGFELGTPLLHLTGAVVGLVVGGVILGMGLVDCEGLDMWSRIKNIGSKEPLRKKRRKKTAADIQAREQAQAETVQRLEVIRKTLALHLDQGRADDAIRMMKQMRKFQPDAKLDEPQLVRLMTLLQQARRWDDVLYYSDEYLASYSVRSTGLLLNQARIQLEEKHRPRKSLEVLARIDQSTLNEKQRPVFARFVQTAKQRVQSGDLDFSD